MPLGDMPERILSMYDEGETVLRSNVASEGAELPYDDEWFKIYLWDYVYYHYQDPHTLTLPDGFNLRTLTALYYGACTWVDEQVGRVVAALERNGQDRETVIMFTADHGDNLGSHGLWNKGKLLEESVRIPFIASFPESLSKERGLPAGGTVCADQVASSVDVMPTVLDACGLSGAIPHDLHGQSLLTGLQGGEPRRRWAFVETGGHEIGIRTPSQLLGMRLGDEEGAPGLFYDIQADPFQMSNMTGRGGEIEAELRAELRSWDERTPWLTAGDAMEPDRSFLGVFDEHGMPVRDHEYWR